MNIRMSSPDARPAGRAERVVSLALAGGNALGAYEAGAYEALHDAGYAVDRISASSIGAINAAIIAGNRPERRVDKLREFWRMASRGSMPAPPMLGAMRDTYNKWQAWKTFALGRPGLFTPRPTGLWSLLPGTWPDIGLFDMRPLLGTLPRVVDFELLNEADVRLLIASVDLESGQAVYFDNREHAIAVEHVMASTAFIPGFPPVEIDGRSFGDPGMSCNLPLDPLLAEPPDAEHLCFAIDLFDARGRRPFSMDTALERAQDIAFASQSLRTIDAFRREYRLRGRLAEAMPTEAYALDGHDDADERAEEAPRAHRAADTHVVLLAYTPPPHEIGAKTLDFSAASIAERWTAGHDDMRAAIDRFEAGHATTRDPGFVFHDGRRSVQ